MSRDDLYGYDYFGYNVGKGVSEVVDTHDQARKWRVVLTDRGLRFSEGFPRDLTRWERREILSAAGRDFATRPGAERSADRARRKLRKFIGA